MDVKRFLIKALYSTETVIRWLIFIIVAILMIFIFIDSLQTFFSTYSVSTGQFTSSSDPLEKYLAVWKAYRNLTYLLLTINLPLVIFKVVRDASDKEKAKNSYKPILYWYGLLLLVTFSYALVGLVIDLTVLAFIFHTLLVQNASQSVN